MEPLTAASLYSEVTFPALRLGSVVLILAVSLPLAILVGYASGAAWRRRLLARGREIDSHVGETTTGAFMALLGLLLAFAFSNSLNASQAIRNSIVDEAAALGTVFLRADLLADPGRTELQVAILDYARTRVPSPARMNSREAAIAYLDRSLSAQARLWPLTIAAIADPTPPTTQGFVAGAMNAAFDAHLHRMGTMSMPLSALAQVMVLAAVIAALFLRANRLGMIGRAPSWRTFLLAGFLGVLMYVVVDIRRANEGLIRVDASILEAAIFDMEQALAGRL